MRNTTPLRGITFVALIALAAMLMAFAVGGNAATAAQGTPETAFITINPEAGFPLDPFVISLQAGGPVDAGTVAEGCKGFVAQKPGRDRGLQRQVRSVEGILLQRRRPGSADPDAGRRSSCATTTPTRPCSTRP